MLENHYPLGEEWEKAVGAKIAKAFSDSGFCYDNQVKVYKYNELTFTVIVYDGGGSWKTVEQLTKLEAKLKGVPSVGKLLMCIEDDTHYQFQVSVADKS